MIRVNLLRNRIQDTNQTAESTTMAGVGGGGGGGGGRFSSVGSELSRDALIKFAAVAVFTLVMILYESQNLRSLNEELARMKAQLATTQETLTNRLNEVAKNKDVEIQAKELEDKLKILKLLSKLRLREVKTLDFMQTSIPEKVWLKSINYEADKAHPEGGHYRFAGGAMATENLSEFVKRLDDSSFLMDVIVLKNQEVAVAKSTPVREFMFTAEVENKN